MSRENKKNLIRFTLHFNKNSIPQRSCRKRLFKCQVINDNPDIGRTPFIISLTSFVKKIFRYALKNTKYRKLPFEFFVKTVSLQNNAAAQMIITTLIYQVIR